MARVNGHVVPDASASARHALILLGRGSARSRVRVRATSRLTVVVRADACGGAPRLVVALDGGRARSARVTTRRWTGAATGQTIAPGMHRIALRLANPHRSSRCRRDLRVDRLVFVFAAPPAAPGGGGGTTPQPPVPGRWVPAPEHHLAVAAHDPGRPVRRRPDVRHRPLRQLRRASSPHLHAARAPRRLLHGRRDIRARAPGRARLPVLGRSARSSQTGPASTGSTSAGSTSSGRSSAAASTSASRRASTASSPTTSTPTPTTAASR